MTRPSYNGKNKNFCKFCNKIVIGCKYKFESHLFCHNEVEARFKCEYCCKEYFRLDAYTTHIKSHHRNSREIQTKKYICNYCDRIFLNKYNLIAHLKRIHNDDLKFDVKKFTCIACDTSYCDKRFLIRHIRKTHFNIEMTKEPSHVKKLINESWIEKVSFKNARVQITKVNNNVIVIQRCMKVEDVEENNVKVKKVVFNSQYENQFVKVICDYCKKEMLKKSLISHIRERHYNIRKYNCTECSKTFKRHYQLLKHKNINNCGQNVTCTT